MDLRLKFNGFNFEQINYTVKIIGSDQIFVEILVAFYIQCILCNRKATSSATEEPQEYFCTNNITDGNIAPTLFSFINATNQTILFYSEKGRICPCTFRNSLYLPSVILSV